MDHNSPYQKSLNTKNLYIEDFLNGKLKVQKTVFLKVMFSPEYEPITFQGNGKFEFIKMPIVSKGYVDLMQNMSHDFFTKHTLGLQERREWEDVASDLCEGILISVIRLSFCLLVSYIRIKSLISIPLISGNFCKWSTFSEISFTFPLLF